jgi:hypothetical protein
MDDRALPSGVRGPVGRLLFIQLAFNCFSLTGFLATGGVVLSAMVQLLPA